MIESERTAARMVRAASAAALLLALAGCTTGQLLQQPPSRTYHSGKSRAALADCLLNRLAGSEFRIDSREQRDATLVRASQGLTGVTYFLFTIRDDPVGGSAVEMRRANSVAPGLHNAETCF